METLTLNKFSQYIDYPEGYWEDYLENNRILTLDEQIQYLTLCEVYSDLYAYFMCKKAFTEQEVQSLQTQYTYFKKIGKDFKTVGMRKSLPKRIIKEIAVMERNLERYFAQFNKGG